MKAVLPFFFFMLLCAGCARSKPHNDAIATYEKIGDRYVIEVTGTRPGVVHDPVSALFRKTYEFRQQFDVPRIEGEIAGGEIHQEPGHYSYLGSIAIHGTAMAVNLSFDNFDDKRIDHCSWNGDYTLVEKKQPNQPPEPTRSARGSS